MNSFYSKVCISAVSVVGLSVSAVSAQILPKLDYFCPNGTRSYQNACMVNQGTKGQYIPKLANGGCPMGTISAGQGYCKSNN
jgi:hypothetical protein